MAGVEYADADQRAGSTGVDRSGVATGNSVPAVSPSPPGEGVERVEHGGGKRADGAADARPDLVDAPLDDLDSDRLVPHQRDLRFDRVDGGRIP